MQRRLWKLDFFKDDVLSDSFTLDCRCRDGWQPFANKLGPQPFCGHDGVEHCSKLYFTIVQRTGQLVVFRVWLACRLPMRLRVQRV